MFNSEVLVAIKKLCVQHTAGIRPEHVDDMLSAVCHGFYRLIEEKENWRDTVRIIRIFEDAHPIEIFLGNARSREILERITSSERIAFGYDIPIHTPAYKAYWQRLWLCTFYVLRASRSDPPVREASLTSVS